MVMSVVYRRQEYIPYVIYRMYSIGKSDGPTLYWLFIHKSGADNKLMICFHLSHTTINHTRQMYLHIYINKMVLDWQPYAMLNTSRTPTKLTFYNVTLYMTNYVCSSYHESFDNTSFLVFSVLTGTVSRMNESVSLSYCSLFEDRVYMPSCAYYDIQPILEKWPTFVDDLYTAK